MIFTIFSNNTGEISRTVQCSESMIDAQLMVGEEYIEGRFNDEEFIIDVGTKEPIQKVAIAPPEPTLADSKRAMTRFVQSRLDNAAMQKGYDDIVSACSYAGAPNPFQQESIDFLNWRSSTWTYCYQVLADVEAGIRPIPTEEELLAELPQLVFTTN